MAKHYVYTNTKTNRIIFETVQPNHVSIDYVDKLVLNETGNDPRLNPVLFARSIRVVPDGYKLEKKRLTNRKK